MSLAMSGCRAIAFNACASAFSSPSAGTIEPMAIVDPAVRIDAIAIKPRLSIYLLVVI